MQRKSKDMVVGEEIASGVRKIIKIGGSHYISLPKEFLDKYNLKEGDEVAIVVNDIIRIIPRSVKDEEKT